jgi:hypothetical protein
MPSLAITAPISSITAIIVAVVKSLVTYVPTKRREREADWRKLSWNGIRNLFWHYRR